MTDSIDKKKHWENVYSTKKSNEVSWFQQTPETSLSLIEELDVDLDAPIIDIGAGDSILAEHLLKKGYTDITVLDISEEAINRAKTRLGKAADKIQWIVSDITSFVPERKYTIWHDRATFHFLTDPTDIRKYVNVVSSAIPSKGAFILGTFSQDGPTKCSGIEIRQYTEDSMNALFQLSFEKMNCQSINHQTPFDTNQDFIFCTFIKR